MMSPGKKADSNNSNNSTIVLDPSLPTPRGSHAILAQQIDQEILELRNFFDDHREEMLFLISDQPQTQGNLLKGIDNKIIRICTLQIRAIDIFFPKYNIGLI